MKKFLLFAAAAMVAASASAAETVLVENDFSKMTEYKMWTGSAGTFSIKDGGLSVTNEAATENFWDLQYAVAEGMKVAADTEYTVAVKIKGFKGSLHYVMGAWGTDVFSGAVTVEEKADWQTVTFKGSASADVEAVHVLLQSGEFVGTYVIESVKITYGEGGDTPDEGGNTLDMLASLSNDAYDAATKTITFGAAWGWVNWWFGEGDFSEYDNFVIEFEPVTYTVKVMVQYNEGEGQAVQAQAGGNKIVVPLDAERKKSIKQIAIQNSEPGSLTLTAAYFAASSSGVHTLSAPAVNNGVYNLQGVKVANSLEEVTVPGLYITNGKKVIKK